jgi:hypothetical protein
MSKPVFHGRVTFEHDTLSLALCLGWKIHLSPEYKITNWSMIPVVDSVFRRKLSRRQYVQREIQPRKPSIVSAIFVVFNPSIASAIPVSFLNHLLL